MDSRFEKAFADAVKDEKEFRPILRDEEFLEKVFPQGNSASLVQY